MSVWNFYKKAMSTSLKMGKSTSNHVASRVLNWQNATPRSVLNSGYYLNDDKRVLLPHMTFLSLHMVKLPYPHYQSH